MSGSSLKPHPNIFKTYWIMKSFFLQVRSCLDWTPFTRCCGSSFWRKCFWACPVSTRGEMRWCCSSTSSTGRCCYTLRTAPSSGSTQQLRSTPLCTSTISSPWAVTSGSCQPCCRYCTWVMQPVSRKCSYLKFSCCVLVKRFLPFFYQSI